MTTARRVDVVDTYHGQTVADPYRWLEDQEADEVRAWWQDQNAATRALLDAVPVRKRVKERLESLLALPRVSTPVARLIAGAYPKNELRSIAWFTSRGKPATMLAAVLFGSTDAPEVLKMFSTSLTASRT